MEPAKSPSKTRSGVLVGRAVTIRSPQPRPSYFTATHERWVGKTGRVHAIVASASKENPLIKVGFDDGKQIVFYRKSELTVEPAEPSAPPKRHGRRGSFLP